MDEFTDQVVWIGAALFGVFLTTFEDNFIQVLGVLMVAGGGFLFLKRGT